MPGGKRAKWLWIALLYVLILEGLSWWSSPASGPCLISQQEHGQPAKNDNQETCPTLFKGSLILLGRADHFIESHDKSIVAVFTIVLAISTIGLWLATINLWRAGERQMELIAASSAQQSRPYVYVFDVRPPAINKMRGSDVPIIRYTVANFGKTPARIDTVAIVVHYSTGPAYVREVDWDHDLMRRPVLPPNDLRPDLEAVCPKDVVVGLTEILPDHPEWSIIRPATIEDGHLRFKVTIWYRGPFGGDYETRSSWRYEPEPGCFREEGGNQNK